MKLPKVPFLILIDHNDINNIVKYQALLYNLGARSCLGGTGVFTGMASTNEGVCVSCRKIVAFSNIIKIKKEGGKIYTMKEFDDLGKGQIEFDF